MSNFGEDFDLKNEEEIIRIISPKNRISGSIKIIYKCEKSRFVIVSLIWKGSQSFGIRWFHGSCGTPNSRGIPTWFILPQIFNEFISGLVKDDEKLTEFLKVLAK